MKKARLKPAHNTVFRITLLGLVRLCWEAERRGALTTVLADLNGEDGEYFQIELSAYLNPKENDDQVGAAIKRIGKMIEAIRVDRNGVLSP